MPTYPVYVDAFGCRHTGIPDELGRLKVEASAIHRDGFFGGDLRTPSSAKMFVTNLDVRVRFKPDIWTPGLTQWFCSHGNNNVGTLAWTFTQHSNQHLRTAISSSGLLSGPADSAGPESTVPFSKPLGQEVYLRTTVDTDIGGGLMEFGYWESLDRGLTWEPIGDAIQVTGAPFDMFNSAADLGVPGLTANAAGAYYEFDWRADIDSPTSIVYADFTHLDPPPVPGQNVSFTGETGELWTTVGANAFNPVVVGKCFV